MGSKAHDAENHGQFVLDVIDEQIEATTRAFLALTVACARCHDHKMDPISQRDYYALSGIFRSTRTCAGTLPGVFPNFNASPLLELPGGAGVRSALPPLPPEQRTAMEKRLAALVHERDSIPPGEANRDRLRRTNSLLAMVRYRLAVDPKGGLPRAFAMGVRDRDEVVESPLYVRGELDQPGEVVPRGLVRVLCDGPPDSIAAGSGRRELADWLASPTNPLTARVIVNRVWLHLFGRGLVPTPDNFGRRPAAQPSGAARQPRRGVHGRGLVDQAVDPPDCPQPRLRARLGPRPTQFRGRPRQRPRLAHEPAPARCGGVAGRHAVY